MSRPAFLNLFLPAPHQIYMEILPPHYVCLCAVADVSRGDNVVKMFRAKCAKYSALTF